MANHAGQSQTAVGTQYAEALLPPEAAKVEIEIRDCLNEWIDQISNGTPESVAALYSDTAVLLATFEATPLNTPVGRKNYFDHLMAKDSLKAELGDHHVEVLDRNNGMANGLYTFSFIDEHKKPQTIAARFTFVYKRNLQGDLSIAAHHSSVMPPRSAA